MWWATEVVGWLECMKAVFAPLSCNEGEVYDGWEESSQGKEIGAPFVCLLHLRLALTYVIVLYFLILEQQGIIMSSYIV